MRRTPFFFLLIAVILLFASCKDTNKSGLNIPKDAAFVFHINSSSLASKLSWEDIKKTAWFKDMHQEAGSDSLAQKILDNPEASGIDVKSDFAFFIKKRGRGGYGIFEGGIKDASAFEAALKKMMKKDKVEKDGDWSMIVDNRSVTAWNNSRFAVINDMPISNINPMERGNDENNSFGSDSLKVFLKQNLTLSSSESLFDDDRFSGIMKESGDMHMWVNTSLLYPGMSGMFSMMKFSTLLEGNASGATINFEDGKISLKTKQFYGKEMQKIMDKWKSKNIDAATLKRIPSQDVIGVFAMNVDPAAMQEMFKTMGLDGMANMFLSKQGLTFDELVNASKGQVVFAVTDLKMKDTTYVNEYGATTRSNPDASFLFATNVNQKATFDKLLNMGRTNMGPLPFSYQLNNDWFIAGNKEQSVNTFLTGTSNISHPFIDKLSGHPFGMYVDIQRLLKTNFTSDTALKSLLDESAATWKDFVAVSNDYKGGTMTGEVVINMVDGKTNSLKQINNYIEKMNTIRKANKPQYQDMQDRSDSTMVMPMPPSSADSAE